MISKFSKFESIQESKNNNKSFLYEDLFSDDKSNISNQSENITKKVISNSSDLKEAIIKDLYYKLKMAFYGSDDGKRGTGAPEDFIIQNSSKLIDAAKEINETGRYSTFWRTTMGWVGTLAVAAATALYIWKKRKGYKKSLRYTINPEVEQNFIKKTNKGGVQEFQLKQELGNYKKGTPIQQDASGRFYVLGTSGSKDFIKLGYDKELTKPLKDILLEEWKSIPNIKNNISRSTFRKLGIFLSKPSQPQFLGATGVAISLPFIYENINVLWDWFMDNAKEDEAGYKTFLELSTVIAEKEMYAKKFYQALIQTPAFSEDLDLDSSVIYNIPNYKNLSIDGPNKIGYAVSWIISETVAEHRGKFAASMTIYSALSKS